MPSVANNSAPKMENKPPQSEPVDVVKNVITIIDKKVRNLEKRKNKLDGYRQESAEGKTLNSDQKQAVSHYDEVIHSLEMARDLAKQFEKLGADYERSEKKRKKKELVEKQQAELARLREVLLYQDTLNKMGAAHVRGDFLAGRNGAVTLTEEDLGKLDAFYPLASVPQDEESNLGERLSAAAEHLQLLLDGRPKDVAGTTYRELRELLQKIATCGYFEHKPSQEETSPQSPLPENTETQPEVQQPVEEYEAEPPVIGNGDSVPAPVDVIPPAPSVPYVPQPSSFLAVDVGTDFNFLQESIIDQSGLPLVPPASVPLGVVPTLPSAVPSSVSMVSMDPAVVMVHPQMPHHHHLGFSFLPTAAGGTSLYGPPLVPIPSMMNAEVPQMAAVEPKEKSCSPEVEAVAPQQHEEAEKAAAAPAWADEEVNDQETNEEQRDDNTWTNSNHRSGGGDQGEHFNRRGGGGYRGRGNPRGRGGGGGGYYPRGGYGGGGSSGDRDRDRSYQPRGGPRGAPRGGSGFGGGGFRGGRGGPRGGGRGGFNERPDRH